MSPGSRTPGAVSSRLADPPEAAALLLMLAGLAAGAAARTRRLPAWPGAPPGRAPAGRAPAGAPPGTCGRPGHDLELRQNPVSGDHHCFSALWRLSHNS